MSGTDSVSMSATRLLPLAICLVLASACGSDETKPTVVGKSYGVAIQSLPGANVDPFAQAHCAKYGKTAVFLARSAPPGDENAVISQYACQ